MYPQRFAVDIDDTLTGWLEYSSRDFGDMKIRDLGTDGLSELICRQVFLARRAFSVYPRQARRVLRRQKHPSGRIAPELNFLM
jgi:hypothetical protein